MGGGGGKKEFAMVAIPRSWRKYTGTVDAHKSSTPPTQGPPFPYCSWVQIGIEKSRSQLKLGVQRIWRDKIPIISCPPPPPVPSIPSVRPSLEGEGGDWASEVTEGGGESAYKNSIPLSIEVNKTRQFSVDGHLYNAALASRLSA